MGLSSSKDSNTIQRTKTIVKPILLTLLSMTAYVYVYSQDISELDRRNGFKSIRLGSHIDSIKGAEFKKDFIERKEFPAKLYQTEHPEYKSIGEVPIKKVELYTYSSLIYEIHIYLQKDPRVMQGLEKAFGPSVHSMRMNAYYWKGENLSLIYEGEGKQIHLTYRSAPVIRMMYTDKSKKTEDIAQDF